MSKRSAINTLVPEGLVVSRKYLLTMGFTVHQLDNIIKSGKLVSVARGVYRKPGPPLKWQAVVISLQGAGMGELELAVGGSSALALHGMSHYLQFGMDQVHLYGPDHVPDWVEKLCLETKFVHHGGNLFKGVKAVQKNRIYKPEYNQGEQSK